MDFRKPSIIISASLVIASVVAAQTVKSVPMLGKSPINDVVKALTLDEKIRMVVGTATMPPLPPSAAPGTPVKPPVPAGTDFSTFLIKGKVDGAAGEGFAIPRLGIPALVYADGPAGLRIDPVRKIDTSKKYYATAFPVATLLASSWDTATVRKVGRAMGQEVHEYGVDVLLAPGMNIQRNPLTGRNFEYYSEDPMIAGEMATAMVRGLQENNIGVSVKHFAVNNQETYRNGVNAVLSERTLREIYLRGFQKVITKARPWTVMSSYNKVNGSYASESSDLLTTILRQEWGFKGFVMTDWWAEHDAVTQQLAGNDLLMPGTPAQIEQLKSAVKSGKLSISIIDRNVKRILEIILQSPSFAKYKYSDQPDLAGHAAIAQTAAEDGMILLKNHGKVLPFAGQIRKVALFGNAAYDIIAGGSGSGYVNKKYKINLDSGIQQSGYQADHQLSDVYHHYITVEKAKLPAENFWAVPITAEMPLSAEMVSQTVQSNDIAVITIGRNSGEGDDRKLAEDYYLSAVEIANIKMVAEAFHARNKPVIAVLNIGGVMETASWEMYFDGILLAWQPGQEAGHAIAAILSGKVSPSGKLAVTFPIKYEDVPSAGNFPKSDNDPSKVKYEEGIYVGYRYYLSFGKPTTYPFGFGLSYTSFKYGTVKLNHTQFDLPITVNISVTNSGDRKGREVVQLYLSAPALQLDKPKRELKAFCKTRELRPGESQVITFQLTADLLASFNSSRSSWIADAGEYQVSIGSSSESMLQTAGFKLPKNIVVENVRKLKSKISGLQELKMKAGK